MNFIPQILAIAGIHLLAVMSPGPDFILTTKNALVHSRRAGIYTALGLALGTVTHITYSLAGIGLIISKSILLFNTIKYIGAAYLIYIGIKAMRSKKNSNLAEEAKQTPMSDWQAFKSGYITNATNPKVTLFMLSLFTLIISPNTPLYVKLIMGAEMTTATVLWFSFVSVIVSHRIVRGRFRSIQHRSEQFMGFALVALGVKVALSPSK